jgi:hypothetical protein
VGRRFYGAQVGRLDAKLDTSFTGGASGGYPRALVTRSANCALSGLAEAVGRRRCQIQWGREGVACEAAVS